MSRTKGSTNESIFQTFKTTDASLSPIDNLMLAVYEQAVNDLRYMVKSGASQLDRTQVSFADIYNFFDKSYYNDYMTINGKEIYNLAMNELIQDGYVNDKQIEALEDSAIKMGVKADRIAYDRYTRENLVELTRIEKADLDDLELDDDAKGNVG